MHKVYMNSSEHDVHVAYISHISHITSFSLALSVLEKEQEEQNILTLEGGGFESTVRLAKSNGETWAPIFLENAQYILEVMDTYIDKMNSFRKMISENIETIRLSKTLATLDTGLQVEVDMKDLAVDKPDWPSLLKMFSEFEFSSLIKMIPAEAHKHRAAYATITDRNALKNFLGLKG